MLLTLEHQIEEKIEMNQRLDADERSLRGQSFVPRTPYNATGVLVRAVTVCITIWMVLLNWHCQPRSIIERSIEHLATKQSAR